MFLPLQGFLEYASDISHIVDILPPEKIKAKNILINFFKLVLNSFAEQEANIDNLNIVIPYRYTMFEPLQGLQEYTAEIGVLLEHIPPDKKPRIEMFLEQVDKKIKEEEESSTIQDRNRVERLRLLALANSQGGQGKSNPYLYGPPAY